MKTYSYIGAFITHLHCQHKDKIVHISAKHLPDDGGAIEHDNTVHPFVYELQQNIFLRNSNNDTSDTDGYSRIGCTNQDQP